MNVVTPDQTFVVVSASSAAPAITLTLPPVNLGGTVAGAPSSSPRPVRISRNDTTAAYTVTLAASGTDSFALGGGLTFNQVSLAVGQQV